MFELMVGIDGVQRRMTERAEKERRREDLRRSRLRAAVAARTPRPAETRPDGIPLAHSR